MCTLLSPIISVMWSSLQKHSHSHSHLNHKRPSSTTTTTFTSSSSSSSSSCVLPQSSSKKKKKKSMEEVWKDISVPPPPPPSSFRRTAGMRFQDFLAGPMETPSDPMAPPLMNSFSLPPPPTTALSLNSPPGLCFPTAAPAADDFRSLAANRNISSSCFGTFVPSAFSDHAIAPPAVGLFSFCPDTCNRSADGDARHKRMMKNRESASRSRARKQAYTKELELEGAHLLAENEKLRKKCLELSSAMAAQQPKKTTLRRTLTAPF